MSWRKKYLKTALPFFIVLFGAGVMAALVSSRPEPKKETKGDPGALVRVLKVKKDDRGITVEGTGTVRAAREVTVIPQVSGRVTHVAPSFVSGGFFRQGGLLFEIEDTDYLLALERARAAKAAADYELATIEGQARVARSEWERLNNGNGEEPNPLVVYGPQLKSARAAAASAEAGIKQAETDLGRTRVRAPFNARVRSENIDVGQYVRAGNSVAVLAGTDTAEIVVPLGLEELGWLDIPGRPGRKGSPATVSVDVGGSEHRWRGRVVRSMGEMDPKSRMMQIVAAVDDPYGLRNGNGPRPALAVGAFVDVLLEGRTLTGVYAIPRTALRDGSTVWTVDGQNKLRIRKVVPLRVERREVVIAEGLNDGDTVVLTTLSGAADGMKLRLVREKGE
jgi:RND family efflux transporter MFP subunit